MKTNFQSVAIAACILMVSIFSCTEIDLAIDGDGIDHPSAGNFTFFTPKTGITKTIDAESGGEIMGPEGTLIIIPEDAIIDQAGNPVTGDVMVELFEYYKTGDFVINNINVASNGQMLVSGGTFFWQIKKGNEVLKVDPSASIVAALPKNTNAGTLEYRMKGFTGSFVVDSGASDSAMRAMNWEVFTNELVVFDTGRIDSFITIGSQYLTGEQMEAYRDALATLNLEPRYLMEGISPGWFNVDAFTYALGKTIDTKVSVEVTGYSDRDQTLVYIFLEELTSLFELRELNGSNWTSTNNTVPTGCDIKILVVSKESGQLEYGLRDITVSGNDQVLVNSLTPISQNELYDLLNF